MEREIIEKAKNENHVRIFHLKRIVTLSKTLRRQIKHKKLGQLDKKRPKIYMCHSVKNIPQKKKSFTKRIA